MSRNTQGQKRARHVPPVQPTFPNPAILAEEEELRQLVDSLSPEQTLVFECALAGDNEMVHGPAGTGKSRLIDAIMRTQKDEWTIAASSGCAAALLGHGACTLHSLLGIGRLEPFTFPEAWKVVSKNKFARRTLEALKKLIIDEISMSDARMVVIADLLLRVIKKCPNVPFGGVQVILCGDFLQLPPIWRRDNPDDQRWLNVFAFHAFALTGFNPRRFDLTRVFRQKDPEFIAFLNNARVGKLSERHRAMLLDKCRTSGAGGEAVPTELMGRNKNVDAHNLQRLNSKPDRLHISPLSCVRAQRVPRVTGRGVDFQRLPWKSQRNQSDTATRIITQLNLDRKSTLCMNAKVIVRANVSVEQGIANGSCGNIKGFITVQDMYGAEAPEFPEFCIAPWGKEEESTTELITGDLKGRMNLLPVVHFPHLKASFAVGYYRFEMKMDGASGICGFLYAIPLKLAWAMTVDRAQGASIPQVRVALRQFDREALNYVAVSRVPGFEGLELAPGDKGKLLPDHPFRANPVAVRYFGKARNGGDFGQPFKWPVLPDTSFASQETKRWILHAVTLVAKGEGGSGLGNYRRAAVTGRGGHRKPARGTSSRGGHRKRKSEY
jgi:ATP-dependent DNA helicase PIF1